VHALLIAAFVLPWVLVGFMVYLLAFAMHERGDAALHLQQLQRRIWDLEAQIEPPPEERPGLELGVDAPPVELTDLDGRRRSLAEFRGQPVVLVFSSPDCAHSRRLAPELGRLPENAPAPVVITHGDAAENRALASRSGWTCPVLLDDAWQVVDAYNAIGTPSAYLIDGQGRIASSLAVGQEAILALFDPLSYSPDVEQLKLLDRARAAGLRVRDTSESRINRDGLKAGEDAPTFVLPDLDGRPRSLLDYRGTRVLLVFSDPGCGPCEVLMRDLAPLFAHDGADGLQLLVVGRGDPDANRAHTEYSGFGIPVLLQRGREIAKQYGIFATPAGYLIDEQGVIEQDVAVGALSVLELARPGSVRTKQ
jgi:peroxiredoxin